MFFRYSFPIKENINVSEIRTRIKRINRFFQMKADLSGKSRSFGVQLLTPNNERLEEYLGEGTFTCNENYYLFFKFFNAQRQEQPKLEFFLNLGNSKELVDNKEFEIYSLSNMSGLSTIKNVIFSYSKKDGLVISVEPTKEHEATFYKYLDMLADNYIKKYAQKN